MFKIIMIFIFFSVVVAGLKPTPSVQELTDITKIHCRDICK